MLKQYLSFFLILFVLLFQAIFTGEVKAQTNNPRDFGERFAVRSVRLISSAEATFQATVGNGSYGSFSDLRQANFIDEVLATGEKYGYHFVLSKTNATTTMPAKFYLTATPRNYPKSGRRSFYIDETGEMHGANKNGGVATAADPLIDDCTIFGILANERCVILDMRTLASAQMTYRSTVGNGNYGSFPDLFAAGLINSRMAAGTNHGYTFSGQTIFQIPGFPAVFNFKATPANYGVTGFRSFYIDVTGIMRGADHQGQPADENDPRINN